MAEMRFSGLVETLPGSVSLTTVKASGASNGSFHCHRPGRPLVSNRYHYHALMGGQINVQEWIPSLMGGSGLVGTWSCVSLSSSANLNQLPFWSSAHTQKPKGLQSTCSTGSPGGPLGMGEGGGLS